VLGPKPWSPQLFSRGCAPESESLLNRRMVKVNMNKTKVMNRWKSQE